MKIGGIYEAAKIKCLNSNKAVMVERIKEKKVRYLQENASLTPAK